MDIDYKTKKKINDLTKLLRNNGIFVSNRKTIDIISEFAKSNEKDLKKFLKNKWVKKL